VIRILGLEHFDNYDNIAGTRTQVLLEKEREKQECYRACFAIELAGVFHKKEDTKDKIVMNTIWRGLEQGQRVDLIYRTGGKGTGFEWLIRGICREESPDKAISSATGLWHNLRAMLGVIGDYHFEPVRTSEACAISSIEGLHEYEIIPRSVMVMPSMPIGFLRDETPSGGIAITPFKKEKELRRAIAVFSGALEHPAGVEVVLSIKGIRLGDGELQRVASTLRWLQGCVNDAHKGKGSVDKEIIEDVIYNLGLWLREPSGIRIRCRAYSALPIPGSYLYMVGQEIFNCPVSVGVRGSDVLIDPGADVLDLRNCINSQMPSVSIFPDPLFLLEHGVKRVFAQRCHDLPADGILLGYHMVDKDREIRFSRHDRNRHCYLIGATGTGKSTLLYNMIRQDIDNGEGVTLIDPHGDLYQRVLRSIPPSRVNDVVLVDLCDFEYSVGINFLECEGRYKHIQMNYVTNEMIKIFDRLYDLRQTGGPIFEQYMRNALLLVMDNEVPGATLMDIPMIFEDDDYREFMVSSCKNPVVKSFWANQAEKVRGDASLKNIGPYITSKLNQFTSNALLRPIIGQPRSTINFREIMDKGKILLVNLSKGLLGDMDTRLLGMLIIGKIFSSAMGRVEIPPEQRRPMFLYVDEFQNFTTDTVAHLLSESRKFGICLTLANQNLSQLDDPNTRHNIIDAVLGNVGTMMIFRLGTMDAERMKAYTMPEIDALDLQSLPDFHVVARFLNNNMPTRPFVFKTLSMSKMPDVDVSNIIMASQKAYTRPTVEVEQAIISRRISIKKMANI